MRAVAPRTGAPEVTIAEDQPEYLPVTVAIYDHGNHRTLLCRFTFTAEERAEIAAGADLYVGQLNFPHSPGMTPINVRVGPGEWQLAEDGG
jgi:hypothetical protein